MLSRLDTRNLLSALWIVVMFNVLTADVLFLYIPGHMDEMLEFVGETPVSRFMLFAAIMIEIPILMILFSRVLRFALNRWLNIIASTITILFVVGDGSTKPLYLFVAFVEVICLLANWRIAWKWRDSEIESAT